MGSTIKESLSDDGATIDEVSRTTTGQPQTKQIRAQTNNQTAINQQSKRHKNTRHQITTKEVSKCQAHSRQTSVKETIVRNEQGRETPHYDKTGTYALKAINYLCAKQGPMSTIPQQKMYRVLSLAPKTRTTQLRSWLWPNNNERQHEPNLLGTTTH